MPKNLPIPGRWFQKVDIGGRDDCWPWTGSRDQDGYGKFQVPRPEGGQQHIRAHRFGYGMLVGPIPDGHLVLHRCDNPPCCNPYHWFTGTNDDNVADKVAKGRQARLWGSALANANKTHCKRGHPLSGDNLSTFTRNGKTYRRCKACISAAERRYRQQRR